MIQLTILVLMMSEIQMKSGARAHREREEDVIGILSLIQQQPIIESVDPYIDPVDDPPADVAVDPTAA